MGNFDKKHNCMVPDCQNAMIIINNHGKSSVGIGAKASTKLNKMSVNGVSGKEMAFPGEIVTYRVISYNKSYVSNHDKRQVKWAVNVNGALEKLKNETNEERIGECLTLKIRPEWTGKEIFVMAYLDNFSRNVGQKTNVIGFPITIAQPEDRRPGKKYVQEENKYVGADDMLCGDMTLEQILDIFNENRYKYILFLEMNRNYKNATSHFVKFEEMLKTYSQDGLLLNEPTFPADLNIGVFLSNKLHRVNLRTNLMHMVTHFMCCKGSVYSNDDLTNAVLSHDDTIRFFNEVRVELKRALGEYKCDSSKDILLNHKKIRKPTYNTLEDKSSGLGLAIHDTWTYEVQMTECVWNDDGTCSGKIKLIIYDHFGLDNNDVTPGQPSRTWYYPKTTGFFHWFLLQRWDAFEKMYRPFITVVEKEIPFVWRPE